MTTLKQAKQALDKVIAKSRIHLYKPIQIAEILHRDRVSKDINLANLEDYRVASKAWRDAISISLVGRKCTSSARFQDDLFNPNAMPPDVLVALGKENRRTNGAVEAYIYNQFDIKHDQLQNALRYCLDATPSTFSIKNFIDSFWKEPGLKRSIDKIYEIIVYSLFSTLVDTLQLEVSVTVKESSLRLLKEFEEFAKKVMCLDCSSPQHIQDAKLYRAGVANAADRGQDMYSNWGPAIQIKPKSVIRFQCSSAFVSSSLQRRRRRHSGLWRAYGGSKMPKERLKSVKRNLKKREIYAFRSNDRFGLNTLPLTALWQKVL